MSNTLLDTSKETVVIYYHLHTFLLFPMGDNRNFNRWIYGSLWGIDTYNTFCTQNIKKYIYYCDYYDYYYDHELLLWLILVVVLVVVVVVVQVFIYF